MTVNSIIDVNGKPLYFDRVIYPTHQGFPINLALSINTTSAINCCIACQNTVSAVRPCLLLPQRPPILYSVEVRTLTLANSPTVQALSMHLVVQYATSNSPDPSGRCSLRFATMTPIPLPTAQPRVLLPQLPPELMAIAPALVARSSSTWA